MKSNRKRGTSPERLLAKAMRTLGVSFKQHRRDLPGVPDFVFARAKVAVFCDGDFWHGRNWRARRACLLRGSNPDYWIRKILSNRKRDRLVTRQLEALGWRLKRVWESSVRSDALGVARQVERMVRRIPSARLSRNKG